MNSKRRFLPVLALWLLGTLSVVAQDFQITSFKENMMDLRAASASIRDKNGDECALIIFSVRDEHFEFEPNMGIVKQEKRAGETWLFVPQQTKRITIRHPQLGVLRDYVIPVNIEKKVVYEAELQITNQDYLSSLLHQSKIDTVRIMVPQEPTVVEVEAERNVHLDLGLGFSALGIMGPTGHIGFNIGHHLIEVGMTFGINKVWDVSIFQADNAAYWGTYDYSAMRFFARYGYNIEASSFIITPLLGAAINNISGSEVRRSPNGDLFGKVSTVSATVACRVSYCIGKTLRLYIAPEFNIGVKNDHSFEILKEVDTTIKGWTDGLGASVGLILHF